MIRWPLLAARVLQLATQPRYRGQGWGQLGGGGVLFRQRACTAALSRTVPEALHLHYCKRLSLQRAAGPWVRLCMSYLL